LISKYSKVIIASFLVLTVIVLVKFYREYVDIQELKVMIAENESTSLSHLIQAFRQTYQKAFAEHQIPIDEKTIELLPVRTMYQISQNFSKLMDNKISIRTISQRPTNPLHLAKPEENIYFQYFKQHPKKDSWLTFNNNNGYLISKPIYIKKGCLKCHGKTKQILPLMKKKYATGFNFKVGEIIGIQLIKYQQNNFAKKLDFIFVRNIIAALIVFLSIFICIFLMLRIIANKENINRLSLEKYNQELKQLTITDHLTRLNNRTHYAQIVDNEINRAKRDNKTLVFEK